jgi:hypothetical protein
VDTPVWWDEPLREEEPREPALPDVKPVKKSPGLGPLFDFPQRAETEEMKPQIVKAPTEESLPEWIRALLASSTLGEQKTLAGRAAPTDEVFVKLLTALDRRGGKLTATALARAIDYPPLRVPGLLAILQRILNIDGYAILTRDEASDTVELNRELLWRQFDLVNSA